MPNQIPVTPPVKKKLPLWLKAIIGIAAVGIGLMVIANVGKSLVKYFVAKKLEEKGIHVGKDLNMEKVLEESFKKAGIDLDLKKGSFAIKDEKTGETQFAINPGGGPLQDFPADIPVFQPSTAGVVMHLGPTQSYQFQTPSPMERVTEFYKKGMPEKGWQEDHSTQALGPQPYMTNWVKGTKTVSIVATPPEEGKTQIIISINEQEGSQKAGNTPMQPMSEKEMKEMQQGLKGVMKELNKLQETKPQK